MLRTRPLNVGVRASGGVRVPRVLVRRESVWVYPRGGPTDTPPEWRGRLLVESYVVYSDARDVLEFEDFCVPVLTALNKSHSHVTVGFLVTPATFDPSYLRGCIERCHTLGHSTVVEIGGSWNTGALELLWAARPKFLRIGPEHVQVAAACPDQFQSVVRVAEFARVRAIPLVARGVSPGEERSALRVAGVDLFQCSESGDALYDPLAELDTLGTVLPPVVLPFPVRPLWGRS